MISQYQHTFRSQKLIHKQLHQKIIDLFANYPLNQYYNYDELLYILDESIHRKCNRDVFDQLFKQSANRNSQTTISQLAEKYIENIETSKLCIMRDEFKSGGLEGEARGERTRDKTFVFLKLIQASIYTRFTKSPIFQYKIEPTELPLVTLANALNPIVNHEYTLQMYEQQFQIIFYQSGIEIMRWCFPDQHDLKEGQYTRFIKSQNVNFEMKIKYMPKNQSKAKEGLHAEIAKLRDKIERQQDAFRKLCCFQPFLQRRDKQDVQINHDGLFQFTENLFSLLPCLRNHVQVLHLLLIIALIVQCLASSFWPIEFIDICCILYILGVIYDREILDYHLKIIAMQIIFLLLILKSIWAGVEEPYTQKTKMNKGVLIAASVIKGIVILVLFITQIRRSQELFVSHIQLKQGQKGNSKNKRLYNILQQ